MGNVPARKLKYFSAFTYL